MSDLPLPVEFRRDVIVELVEFLKQGESCSLVGVGSSGKSNVLRHLKRADVRARYWDPLSPPVLYLYLDCNSLPHYQEFDLYVKILELLADAVGGAGETLADLQPHAEKDWEQAAQSANSLVAQRKLHQNIAGALNKGAAQVVIALDDCDRLVAESPVALRGLRALRDENKYKLVYVTATRLELWTIHPERTPEFETFYELLSAHTLAVPPYNEDEATYMVRRLAARAAAPVHHLNDEEIDRIVQMAGGHAGLLKAIFAATNEGATALQPGLLAALVGNAEVWDECGKIWDSLGDQERAALFALAQGELPLATSVVTLRRKGLVCYREQVNPAIFSPVFAEFVMDKADVPPTANSLPAAAGSIQFDPATRRVNVNGRLVGPLAAAEYELLKFIYDRRPHVCHRLELIERLRLAEPVTASRGTLLAEFVRIMHSLQQQINRPGAEYLFQTPGGEYWMREGQEELGR